jgi:hypothetical protein
LNVSTVNTSRLSNKLRGVHKLPRVNKVTRCWCNCNEKLIPVTINAINSEHAPSWECTKCNHRIFSEQFKESEAVIQSFDFLAKRPEYDAYIEKCLREDVSAYGLSNSKT